MKIYMITIQDGENVYYEWSITKPPINFVDGFLRAVKNITEFNVTKKEIETLEKFRVI